MTDSHTPIPEAPDSNPKLQPAAPQPRRKRRPWLTALKWVAGILVGLTLLVGLLVGVAVWVLTPDRLTPLVEKYGSEFIDGELQVKRVELTYWKSFPRLLLDVDSLTIISHSIKRGQLTEAQRGQLPEFADTLLRVEKFHGGVHILKLLTGEIALRDVIITRPVANIVDVAPGVTNYNIFPTSEEADTARTPIPDISFSRFEIQGNAPIRYIALADSINVGLNLEQTSITPEDSIAGYRLAFAAQADSRIGSIALNNLQLGMGGKLLWRHKSPYRIELQNFETGINQVKLITDAIIDFEHELTIEALDMQLPPVAVNRIISLVPKKMRGEVENIKNNLVTSLGITLTEAYVPSLQALPSVDFNFKIPQGSVAYQQLKLGAFALDVSGHVDGRNPDASVVRVNNLYASGEGVAVKIKGVIDRMLSNPHIDGTFEGSIDFARIPAKLTAQIGATVNGRLSADAAYNLRQSDLTRENFHRVKLTGEAALTNFRFTMPVMEIDFYTHRADFALGTASKFVNSGGVTVDSLLTASVKIDTMAVFLPGLQATGSRLMLGGGIKNGVQTSDTTLITPIGVVASLGRVNLLQTSDSTRLRLRDIKARASVRRFKNMARVPVMNVNLDAGRIRYADRLNRASLLEAALSLTIHPQAPRQGKRIKAAMDSLRRLYPTLAPDSIYRMADRLTPRRKRQRPDSLQAAGNGSDHVDFALDSETRSLLRAWNAAGHLKAKRARLMTPYFPLRNLFTDVDVRFNNDSLLVTDTKYKCGNSDFVINGTITNITRALTSRTGHQPMRINFRVNSDTINVNQLSEAIFAGAAFAERDRQAGGSLVISDSDDDEAVQRAVAASSDTTQSGPLLIPTNIEATIRLNARNVVYADFLFHAFRGNAEVFDGALNLRNLSARTDIGGIDLTALYQGLNKQSLSFAFGMQVRDFHVGKFMELIPSLDTIMPLLKDIDGIVNGEVAATSDLDTLMNLRIPTLTAAVSITGDSLKLLDAETFRKVGKWLLFKNKEKNVIDRMNVKLTVKDSHMELYPFIFNIDRYKLGVFGSNDLDLNFKYHVAVLKSPIPFKFGINISGNPDKMKIRLGGAKLNEKTIGQTVAISDTTRINLVNQIQNIFRHGVARSRSKVQLHTTQPTQKAPTLDENPADTISAADSLLFIREGLLPPKAPTPQQ